MTGALTAATAAGSASGEMTEGAGRTARPLAIDQSLTVWTNLASSDEVSCGGYGVLDMLARKRDQVYGENDWVTMMEKDNWAPRESNPSHARFEAKTSTLCVVLVEET